jgi:hypothetical protein
MECYVFALFAGDIMQAQLAEKIICWRVAFSSLSKLEWNASFLS